MTVTAAAVAAWLKEPGLADDEQLALVCAATESYYAEHYHEPETGRTPATDLGLVMQAARFWRRHLTPEGMANSDFGSFYVPRFDADVDKLLTGRQSGVA